MSAHSAGRGMVIGMASMRKVTVTLPNESVETIRDMVALGRTDSISAFVQHAVAMELENVDTWRLMLGQALEETGGPLTDQERAWADAVFRGDREAADRLSPDRD